MMEYEGYLCLKKSGWKLVARLTKTSPSLEPKEVAVRLRVRVPDGLFTQSQLKATVEIPESAVTPPTLDAQVLDNIKEVLQQQTGMQISLAVVDPVPNVEQ